MVKIYTSEYHKVKSSNSVQADVIILGCSLPGIVTAHKLKKKFGNTVDIVVLNLTSPQSPRGVPKGNVAFQDDESSEDEPDASKDYSATARQLLDNVARYYLTRYAGEFKIPLPDVIAKPDKIKSPLNKLFQHKNGSIVSCENSFHDFEYLTLLEKFEINQYQTLLDQNMRELFQTSKIDFTAETKLLLYYDQTTMESHICDALIFPTSREIMRTTVRLACGAPANKVSVLFYLHQCYRTSSTRNHLDGNNTRLREKLMGFCRKQLSHKLYQSIADITLPTNSIKEIRTDADEKVVLETMKGEKNYICNLLAMAVKPDQLDSIQVEEQLFPEHLADIVKAMKPGFVKKFTITYEENFWGELGFSGDILSIRGPIIWATEKPRFSTTGSEERHSGLIGYLMVKEADESDSKTAVLEQLVQLFGKQAESPVGYVETSVTDIFVPRCGDYVALRRFTVQDSPNSLEWSALDIFAEGDVAAALEAGHLAYLHLLSCLRPQAQSYDDLSSAEWPLFLSDSPVTRWCASINYRNGLRWTMYSVAVYCGVQLLRTWRRQ